MIMSNLEWLRRKAGRYNLVADYVNENTLKVYSPKFYFDSWMIIETENEIELWHMSKGCGLKKCSYHLQKAFPKKFKLRTLERINSHNKYVAFHKRANKINLVDRVLERHRTTIKVS